MQQDLLALRRNILVEEPSSAEAQRNVRVALNSLGDALIMAHEVSSARVAYEECRTMCEAAIAADPGSIQKALDLSFCYRELTVADVLAGRYADAAAWVEQNITISRKAESDPKAAYLKPKEWLISYERERDTLLAAARVGLDDPARFDVEPRPIKIGLMRLRALNLAWISQAASAVKAADDLVKIDPDDVDSLLDAAKAYAFATSCGEPDKKEQYAAAAIETLTRLVRINPYMRSAIPVYPAFIKLRSYPAYRELLRVGGDKVTR